MVQRLERHSTTKSIRCCSGSLSASPYLPSPDPSPLFSLLFLISMILYNNLGIQWMDDRMCFSRTPPCNDGDFCTHEVCRSTDGGCFNVQLLYSAFFSIYILNGSLYLIFEVPIPCLEPTCRLASSNGQTCNGPEFCGVEGGSCSNGSFPPLVSF